MEHEGTNQSLQTRECSRLITLENANRYFTKGTPDQFEGPARQDEACQISNSIRFITIAQISHFHNAVLSTGKGKIHGLPQGARPSGRELQKLSKGVSGVQNGEVCQSRLHQRLQ